MKLCTLKMQNERIIYIFWQSFNIMVVQLNKNQQQRVLIQQNRTEQDLTTIYYVLSTTFIKCEEMQLNSKCHRCQLRINGLRAFFDIALKFNRYFFKDRDNFGYLVYLQKLMWNYTHILLVPPKWTYKCFHVVNPMN